VGFEHARDTEITQLNPTIFTDQDVGRCRKVSLLFLGETILETTLTDLSRPDE
jgi:hypothetical protein